MDGWKNMMYHEASINTSLKRNSHVALSMLGVKGHRNGRLLDTLRPKIHLRSRKNVKFKIPFQEHAKIPQKSPKSRNYNMGPNSSGYPAIAH